MVELTWREHAQPFQRVDELATGSSLAMLACRRERHPDPKTGTYVQNGVLRTKICALRRNRNTAWRLGTRRSALQSLAQASGGRSMRVSWTVII